MRMQLGTEISLQKNDPLPNRKGSRLSPRVREEGLQKLLSSFTNFQASKYLSRSIYMGDPPMASYRGVFGKKYVLQNLLHLYYILARYAFN